MSKMPKSFCADDLKLFDLQRYDPQRLTALGHQGWLDAIANRLLLQRLIQIGDLRYVRQVLMRLLKNPLSTPLGSVGRLMATNASDTPTVRLTPTWMLLLLGSEVEQSGLVSAGSYDEAKLHLSDTGRRPFVTVNVNLMGKRSQIKKDFAVWLDAMDAFQPPPVRRDYTDNGSTIPAWIKGRYLPAFDLHLFGLIEGRPYPQALLAEKLGLQDAVESGERNIQDVLATPVQGSLQAFTVETVIDMWLQLGLSPLPNVKADSPSEPTRGDSTLTKKKSPKRATNPASKRR